jgi:hypothetical protein
MISQRYLPGWGSSWDQNQRRYATLDPGKSTVSGGASGSGVSGPTSDHLVPSFNACPEKRLNVSSHPGIYQDVVDFGWTNNDGLRLCGSQ